MMKDYIRGVRQTAEQLAEMEVKLEKAAVVGFILNGLPDGYCYLVVNLKSQVQTISYEDLSARLMDEEKHMKGREGSSGLEAIDPDTVDAYLASGHRGQRVFPGKIGDKGMERKEWICFDCGESGHVARNCPERFKDTVCRCCGKMGHIKRICSVKKFQEQQGEHMAYSAIFGG